MGPLTRVLCLVATAVVCLECSRQPAHMVAAAPGAAVAGSPSAAAPVSESNVQVLTDATFEQETQAVTGSTSGDWFVKFYAPWCVHCRKLAPVWEELATKLKGQINVAHLDATTNQQTARRFGIRGFPTLLYFKDGQMYNYSGARTVDDLYTFATGGWKQTTGKPIPPVVSWFDLTKDEILVAFQQLRDVFIQFPAPLLMLFAMGCIMGCVLTCLCVALCMGTKGREKKVVVSKKKD
ncbi:thioredoxin, putative [Eimeria tenella]|uniref:Thioredoxin, putative n=1 Tax=Eimeria tenella TaxID=5802 RepID=U6L3H6_EIMTE|nr:thioredoxin, putative [Eimeria tenella]CDJ43169.1 thioredoxin, putative [Eimeria tenella]|eukprot:XP_013233919.1 thioredoxin, putative [Eimeria tenella]